MTGHVDMIADVLNRDNGESVLFLGRPGVGKTTVIREIARVLSDDLQKAGGDYRHVQRDWW